MKIKITNRDIFWNYLGILVGLVINVILLPLWLYFLNSDEIGLWYTFLSIGGISALLDFGFTGTFARNINYCWSGAKTLNANGIEVTTSADCDIPLLKKLIKVSRYWYLLIAAAAFLLLCMFGTMYIISISQNMETKTVIIAWLIFCFAAFLNLYYNYYSLLLIGIAAIEEKNKAMVFSYTVQIFITVLLLFQNFGLIAMAIGYLSNGIVNRMSSKYYFYKYENIGDKLKACKEYPENQDCFQLFKTIWYNAKKDGLVAISNFLITQSNTILCSYYMTLYETGVYAISLQIITAIAKIAGGFVGINQPVVQEAFLRNDRKKEIESISFTMLTYVLVFILGAVGTIVVGIPILRIIKPDTFIDIKIFAFMSLYYFLFYRHYYYASFISTMNIIPYTKGFVISGFLAIVLSAFILQTTEFGIWGMMLTQFIIQAAYNNWKWPQYLKKHLNVTTGEMMVSGMQGIKKHLIRIFKK